MPEIKICPYCLQGYSDTTLSYCVEDGSPLSGRFSIPMPNNGADEAETVVLGDFENQPTVPNISPSEKPKRKRTRSKEFLETHFPELLPYKRRTSRMWESKDASSYYDNWWFTFMVPDLDKTDYIIFVGALDYEDKAFKVFKVPSSFLRENLSNIDITGDGWAHLYIHIRDFADRRNQAGLSFNEFAQN
jgi:hypothetical protein